tara:strand:+ start:972 stop:1154 length:183 start_codon:yes stop_codon:yes gene_type:complete
MKENKIMQDSKSNRMLMASELCKIERVVKALLDPSPKDDLEAISIEVKYNSAIQKLWELA